MPNTCFGIVETVMIINTGQVAFNYPSIPANDGKDMQRESKNTGGRVEFFYKNTSQYISVFMAIIVQYTLFLNALLVPVYFF